MKNVLLLALGLGLMTSCSSDNEVDQITISSSAKLPSSAMDVVNALEGYTLVGAQQFALVSEIGSLYEGVLVSKARSTAAARLEMEFDTYGMWTDVEAESGFIPQATLASLRDLPVSLLSYLSDNALQVEEIERKSYGFKVETISERKYLFDKAGLLLSSTAADAPDESTSGQQVSTEVTAVASAFAAKHFSGYRIMYSKVDTEDGALVYKYYLQRSYRDSYKLVYSAASQLLELEGDEDLRLYIPSSALAEFVPERVVTQLSNQATQVTDAAIEDDHYVLETSAGEYRFTRTGTLVSFERD